ncbi:MAG: hypothetical protein ACTSPB_15535 [Candidatus Thorarchaeota archaeon]
MTHRKAIYEAEILSKAVENIEMLNDRLLFELALRTIRNLIVFRGERND